MARPVISVVIVLAMAVPVVPAVPARAGAGPGLDWRPPVEGPVTRRFAPPAHPGAAGHRGVDFSVPPGTAVRAAGPGRVTFAGTVAGGHHVVVGHAGGVRTSYSFLASVVVRAGTAVEAGTVLGRSGGSGPKHGAGVLHFGARRGGEYVDPLELVGPAPSARVRLAPVDGPPGPSVCRAREPEEPATPAARLGGRPGPRPGIHTPALHR